MVSLDSISMVTLDSSSGSTKGSTIKKLSKAESQVKDLKTLLNTYSTQILEVKNAINEMMKGNGSDSYWQGDLAADWYIDAINQVNKMIGNYNRSYNEFEDLAILIERGKKKGKFKGCGKAAMKAILAGCTGSEYTSGIKHKNMDKEKMSTTLPATVSRDAVNDDQTKESFSKYNAMKYALTNLSRNCDSMSRKWDEVAENTKGTMHSDAKARSTYIIKRRNEIDAAMNNLETSYIGDIIFSR